MSISTSIVIYNSSINNIKKIIISIDTSIADKIYIIDNSPNNLMEKHISNLSNKLIYYQGHGNIGYGAAHNIAIRETIKNNSKYHIVLNHDIEFSNDVILRLERFMNDQDDVGLVMPKIIYPSGEIQHLCKLLPKPTDLMFRRFLSSFFFNTKKYELHAINYSKIYFNIPSLSGCFMMFRVDALKKTGGFDERFFMYMEDVDMTRRILNVAKTAFFPFVSVAHDYEKGSYKNYKLLKYHIFSALKYFNKWGWIFDERRHNINKKILEDIMNNDAEGKVSRFYNTIGWETIDDISEDAKRWEDIRPCAREYVRQCRFRVLRHIPPSGINLLDMASGPIQYPEYLEYSRNFEKRYCIDLSSDALLAAREKIGDHGVFLPGSFFDIPLKENSFDCSISLHTIYHMDKKRQEDAVRKLIWSTKPGAPVIIVYSNPHTIAWFLMLPFRLVKKAYKLLCRSNDKEEYNGLYFFAHPLQWWIRFADVATVKILPWRSFDSRLQKILFPNNKLGARMLQILFHLEDKFPVFFSRFFQYPMVILVKTPNNNN